MPRPDRTHRNIPPFFLILPFFCIPNLSAWDRIDLDPSHDNTLYETAIDQGDQKTEVSNGVGSFLFAGRTGLDAGYKRRRALIRFDLSSGIPDGAEIIFAEFSLHQTKAAPGSPPVEMGLHRVLQSWGEGESNAVGPEGQGNPAEAGDATWHHSHYADVLWDLAGGSFHESASTVTTVGQELRRYIWTCNESLLEDLRFWQSNPELNFGWILIGGEAGGFSAHRFAARENTTHESRPTLTVVYKKPGDIWVDGFEASVQCSAGNQ